MWGRYYGKKVDDLGDGYGEETWGVPRGRKWNGVSMWLKRWPRRGGKMGGKGGGMGCLGADKANGWREGGCGGRLLGGVYGRIIGEGARHQLRIAEYDYDARSRRVMGWS